MNETKNSDVTAENSAIEGTDKSVGTLLQVQRIAAGLSQTDVADKLKLSVRQIEALEHDRYTELPGHVFIRGFVRSYARTLGMEAEPLLARLKVMLPEENFHTSLPDLHEEKTTIHGSYHRRRVRIHRLLFAVIILLILATIGSAVMRYLTPASTKMNEDASMVMRGAALTSDASHTLSASHMASMPIQAGPGVVMASPDAANTPAANTPAANTLQIRAAQDSWVQVVDSNHDTLFQGTVKANTVHNLGGQAPYHVQIGNAQHTTLIYDGKTIDMTTFTKRNVAILEVK